MVSGVRVLMTGALAVLLGSVVTSLAANTTQAGASSTPAVGDRPNIVVVLTDDMRADELRFLPAVRRLRDSGVTFTRAISADSLCCPARATLLTGKLAHNHLTIGNYPKTFGGYPVFAAHNDIEDLLPQLAGRRGLPDGLDRQVPERDAQQRPLHPARLELLRGAGPPGLRLRAQSLRHQRPVALGRPLPRELHPPPPPLEGARLVPRRPPVLRPLLRAGPAPGLAGYGRRPAGCPGEVPATPTASTSTSVRRFTRPTSGTSPPGSGSTPRRTGCTTIPGSWRSIASSPCSASTTRSTTWSPRSGIDKSWTTPWSSSPPTTATCCASTTWATRTRPTRSRCTCRSSCAGPASGEGTDGDPDGEPGGPDGDDPRPRG